MDRRRFLAALAGSLAAVLAAIVATPLVGHLLAPLRPGRSSGEAESATEDGFLPLGPLDAFPSGRPTRVTFEVVRRDGWERTASRQAAWVTRIGDGDVRVLSTVCPHLGCSVKWLADEDAFECPCHDSEFAPDGDRRYGPARRGMDPLPHRVRGGLLEVRWVEYDAGVAERRVACAAETRRERTA